jgi:hypothetical protein
MLPYPKTHPKTHNSQWFGQRWHKEVVSAQGAAVRGCIDKKNRKKTPKLKFEVWKL